MKSKKSKKETNSKSLDDVTIEELLEKLRESQGPGDALIEFNFNTSEIKITKEKTK